MIDLKAEYTLRELADLTGRSPKRVERLLRGAGVEVRTVGGRKTVFLSQLKAGLGELWDSIAIRASFKEER